MDPEKYSIMPNTPGDRANVESPNADDEYREKIRGDDAHLARCERLDREAEEETEDARDYWTPPFEPDGRSLSGDGETADDRNA